MTAIYNVETSSKFDLLGAFEDESPEEIFERIRQEEAEKKKNQEKAVQKTATKKPAPSSAAPKNQLSQKKTEESVVTKSSSGTTQPQNVRGGASFRGGRGGNRRGNENTEPQGSFVKNNDGRRPNDGNDQRKPKEGHKAPNQKARGRQYDRHSGAVATGVKSVMKRDGAGAHNWGADEDEIKDAVKINESKEAEEVNNATVTEEGENKPENSEEVEAEPKTMTVEEYFKNQPGLREAFTGNKKGATQSARKPNEGKDPFDGLIAYRKPTNVQSEEEYEEVEEDASHKKKRVLNVDFHYTRPRGGGSDRGRGTFRGGRGGNNFRGGNRGGNNRRSDNRGGPQQRSHQNNHGPILNESDFPSLG